VIDYYLLKKEPAVKAAPQPADDGTDEEHD